MNESNNLKQTTDAVLTDASVVAPHYTETTADQQPSITSPTPLIMNPDKFLALEWMQESIKMVIDHSVIMMSKDLPSHSDLDSVIADLKQLIGAFNVTRLDELLLLCEVLVQIVSSIANQQLSMQVCSEVIVGLDVLDTELDKILQNKREQSIAIYRTLSYLKTYLHDTNQSTILSKLELKEQDIVNVMMHEDYELKPHPAETREMLLRAYRHLLCKLFDGEQTENIYSGLFKVLSTLLLGAKTLHEAAILRVGCILHDAVLLHALAYNHATRQLFIRLERTLSNDLSDTTLLADMLDLFAKANVYTNGAAVLRKMFGLSIPEKAIRSPGILQAANRLIKHARKLPADKYPEAIYNLQEAHRLLDLAGWTSLAKEASRCALKLESYAVSNTNISTTTNSESLQIDNRITQALLDLESMIGHMVNVTTQITHNALQATHVSAIYELQTIMAQIKNDFSNYSLMPLTSTLKSSAQQLKNIQTSLSNWQLDEASELTERLNKALNNTIFNTNFTPTQPYLNAIAEALVLLEQYLAHLATQQQNNNALQALEQLLAQFETLATATEEPAEAVTGEKIYDDFTATSNKDDLDLDVSPPNAFALATIDSDIDTALSALNIPKDNIEDSDPEITHVFIEELHDVLAVLQKSYTSWVLALDNLDILTSVRRSFHTLKGSGRMVGAKVLGELCWSIERMLNKALDSNLTPNLAMVNLVEQVMHILPPLAEAFTQQVDASNGVKHFIYAANQLMQKQAINNDLMLQYTHHYWSANTTSNPAITADDTSINNIPNVILDRISESTITAPENELELTPSHQPQITYNTTLTTNKIPTIDETIPTPLSTVSNPVTETHQELDTQILNIFLTESSDYLNTITSSFNQIEHEADVTDALSAALHTLRGSAGMLDIAPVYQLASAMESLCLKYKQHKQPLPVGHLALLHLAQTRITTYVNALYTGKKSQLIAEDKHLLAQLHHLTETDFTGENLPQSNTISPINALIALDIDALLDADIDLPNALTTTAPEAYIQTLYVQLKNLELTATTLMLPEIAQLSEQLAAVYNRYLERNSKHTTTLPQATLVQAHATLLSLFDDVAAHQSLQMPEHSLVELATWLSASIEQEKTTNSANVPRQKLASHSTISIQQVPDFNITQPEKIAIEAKVGNNEAKVGNNNADASIDIAHDNTQETTKQTSLQDNALADLDSNANMLTATAMTAKIEPNTTEIGLKNTHISNTTEQSKGSPLPQQASGISLMQSEAFFNTSITTHPTTETFSIQHNTTQHKDNSVASDGVTIQSVTQKATGKSIAPITTNANPTTALTTKAIQPKTPTVVSGSNVLVKEPTQPNGFYEPIDSEMGDIFLEEANEILETMNSALDQWQQTQSITPLRELQRQLHTLKGNARMVGLTTFAQMCHELETLYERQARIGQSSALILRLFNHIHHQIGAELTYLQTHQQLFDCAADIKLLQQYHATLDDNVIVQFFEQLKSSFTQTITALSDHNIIKMLQDTKQDAKVISEKTQTDQAAHTSQVTATPVVDTSNKNLAIDQIEPVNTNLNQPKNSESTSITAAIDNEEVNLNATDTIKESIELTAENDFFATLPTIEIPIANPTLADPHTTPIPAMDDLNVSLNPNDCVISKTDAKEIDLTDKTDNVTADTRLAPASLETNTPHTHIADSDTATIETAITTPNTAINNTAIFEPNNALHKSEYSDQTLTQQQQPTLTEDVIRTSDSILPEAFTKEINDFIVNTQAIVEQTPASAEPHLTSIPTAIPAPAPRPTSNIELLAEQWDIEQTTQDHTQDIFLEEAATLISNCSQNWQTLLLQLHADTAPQGEILTQQYTGLNRQMHTLKGSARIAGFTLLGDIAYQLELRFQALSRAKTSTQADLLQQTATIDYAFEWLTSALRQLDQGLTLENPDALLQAFATENNVNRSSQTTAQVDTTSTAIPPVIEPLPLAMSSAQTNSSTTTLPTATINTVKNLDSAVTLLADNSIDNSSIHTASASEAKQLPTEPPPMEGLFTITTSDESSKEVVRVPSLLLEKLINLSGEDSVYRTRVEMQVGQLTSSLTEMGSAIGRIVEQLRRMEGELEIQIRSRHEKELEIDAAFDPLEMDQYSALNQLSKSLSESASDLQDFKGTLSRTCHDSAVLLHQQSRIQTEIQDQLMSSRLVPFSRILPRLQRLVRQLATELDKKASLNVINPEGLLDRVMLERLVVPLEHMLRNALDHGVEAPEQRVAHGKPDIAILSLSIEHKGGNVHICLKDDGQGIDVDAVKAKAISNGLLDPKLKLSQQSTLQLIFQPGLSTAEQLSQISGRGVGMDIVLAEIKQLGGDVSVDSIQGKGASFTLTLPLTVALTDVLKVKVGKQTYAVPLSQIEKIITLPSKKLLAHYQSGDTTLMIENTAYHVRPLADAVQVVMDAVTFEQYKQLPLLVVKNAGESAALQVDQLVGSRSQIVVKPIGQQLAYVKGIAGATIEGNGAVVLVLDTPALTRQLLTHDKYFNPEQHLTQQQQRKTVLVVDDSVTVRKVTTRILERAGFNAITAFDGVDALETLETTNPDIMILDIEMPRMDGFELATRIKRIHHLTHIPLVMITSRTGEKHREKAFQCGVDCYMGKPFKEAELLQTIHELLESSVAEV